MNVLVIGGSGFIGSHVVDELINNKHTVTVYDINEPKNCDNLKYIEGDILDKEKVDRAISKNDIVYLFASIADIDDAIKNPIDTARTNIIGTVYALDSCVKHRVRKLIFASSVYVYSNEGSFYRCSKQSAELFIEEYNRLYGLNYTIFRYGSLYGPRADRSNGLYNIIENALNTGTVSYQGSPDASREYIHVQDAARSSVLAIDGEFDNESIILTGHELIKLEDLLNMIREILGFKTKISFSNEEYQGHYVKTPYAYQPKLGRKYIPPLHVDLGQGILQLIEEVSNKIKK